MDLTKILNDIKPLMENANKLVDPLITAGCAYYGVKAFGGLHGALAGAVGWQLAVRAPAGEAVISMSNPIFGEVEMPINSQIVGLVILSVIGIVDIALPLIGNVQEWLKQRKEHPEKITVQGEEMEIYYTK